MAVITAIAPLTWIPSHYAYPLFTHQQTNEGIEFAPFGSTQPALRLVSFDVNPSELTPGEAVEVTLQWESIAPMDRDWSVFVHLTDSAGLPVGQRDMYPGQGLIATSQLAPGLHWTEHLIIPVSPSAYSPEVATITMGLYDHSCIDKCPPMTISSGGTEATLSQVEIHSLSNSQAVPNPITFSFENELALAGYSLDPRSVKAGEQIVLMLYWQGLQAMSRNYTVSVQILGLANTKVGQEDSWPNNGNSPTSTWVPGKIIEDEISILVSSDARPGIYDIQIVVYWVDDAEEIHRLQRVTDDGRRVDDFVILTNLRVTH